MGRRHAGTSPLTFRTPLRDSAAFRRAPTAGLRAGLAVIHGMALAFSSALVTRVGAELAESRGEFAAATQQFDGGAAQRGAVEIKGNAAHHAGDVLLLQARRGAVLTFGSAAVAGLDDAFVELVRHVWLPAEGIRTRTMAQSTFD